MLGRSRCAAQQRDREIDPDQAAILAEVALVHRIRRNLPLQQALHRCQVLFQILRMSDLSEGELQQLLAPIADDLAKTLVD